MSSLKELRWVSPPSSRERFARRVAAGLLRRASLVLERLASGVAPGPEAEAVDSVVEFHAEAGAPEGALFVDGRFVGWLSGVTRL